MPYYQVEMTATDDGSILVTAPAFPEVSTSGTDDAQARSNGARAIEEAIAARLVGGEDVPAGDTHEPASGIFVLVM